MKHFKRGLSGFFAISLAVVMSFNVNLSKNVGNHDVSLVALETATATAGEVTCNCAMIWGSGCRADNYGATCAPSGTGLCSGYASNCN